MDFVTRFTPSIAEVFEIRVANLAFLKNSSKKANFVERVRLAEWQNDPPK